MRLNRRANHNEAQRKKDRSVLLPELHKSPLLNGRSKGGRISHMEEDPLTIESLRYHYKAFAGKKKSAEKSLPKSISLVAKVYETPHLDINKRSGEDLRKVLSRKKLEEAYGDFSVSKGAAPQKYVSNKSKASRVTSQLADEGMPQQPQQYKLKSVARNLALDSVRGIGKNSKVGLEGI